MRNTYVAIRLDRWYKKFTKRKDSLSEACSDGNSYVEKQLHCIIRYAVKYVPYYHAYNCHTDLNSIRVVDKSVFRDNYEQMISRLHKYVINWKGNTGGSTGHPFEFLMSSSYDVVHQNFLWKLWGYEPGDLIMAIDGTKIDDTLLSQKIYWTKVDHADKAYGSYVMSSLYLNYESMPLYIKQIEQLKPKFIRGYPSAIYMLAAYMRDHNYHFAADIKGIECTSESVEPYQVKIIEKAFHTRVFGQYGHTESAVFAFTYDDSFTYAFSPYYGYAEIVDEDGMEVKPGETGEIVVTSFTNYAMPFVRYRTGDLAVYKDRKNGVLRVSRILGRTQDYLVNAKGKVLLTALVFGNHFKAFANIICWQIVQDKIGKATIRIIKGNKFCQDDEKEIFDIFKCVADIEISFEYVEQVEKTLSGKSRFVIQKLID
jgi:phenylacetate-CoA ligase